MTNFVDFSNQAKVWVYQADRAFTESEKEQIKIALENFVAEWSAHGKKLKASAEILSDFHIGLAVEGNVEASGCSIDSSVRFVKELGAHLQVDFFNRLKSVVMDSEGKSSVVSYHSLKEHTDKKVFHPIVTNLQELRERWLVDVVDFLP